MIRVGFVLPHLRPGGAERCVVNWLGALDRSRFRPFLFLKRLDGAFLDLLPADVTPVALGGARAARLPGALASALAAARIDVAYSATNAMNLALLAARTKAARIVSEHTSPEAYLAEAKLPFLRRLAMRHFYPRADAVAVPTERIAAELCATLARPLATAVLPNPVIAGAPLRRRVAHDGVFRILSAGRLVPAKGYDTLIDAAALLAGQGLHFHLDIRGEGGLRDDLLARISAAGLTDRIEIAGYGDLAAPMAAADLFVLASRREGFGNVIVEAMAAGLPVLATATDGPSGLIDDSVTGWLVPPEDPPALAAAIARIAADPARDWVEAPAREVAARYTVAAATRTFEALVERIASRSMAA
jgi:glycosyltransferase involved in cell wall biosynthesis